MTERRRDPLQAQSLTMADERRGPCLACCVQVMQLLKQLNAEGQTVIMATHDDRLFDQGTRHFALRLGSIEQQETRLAEAACAP